MATKKNVTVPGTVEEMNFSAAKMRLIKFVSKDFKRHEFQKVKKAIAQHHTKSSHIS